MGNLMEYEAGQELYYLEGKDLVLRVKILENNSDPWTEAYELKVKEIVQEGSSRFFLGIRLEEDFYCHKKRATFFRDLWDLTENLPENGKGIILID
jgi:hypothetical protein